MGCGASGAKPESAASAGSVEEGGPQRGVGSPYLHEYLALASAHAVAEIERATGDPERLGRIAFDSEEEKKFEAECQQGAEEFAKKSEGLLGKSFDHHDVKCDGVLSQEESKLLFDHLVNEKSSADLALAHFAGQAIMRAQMKEMIGEARTKRGSQYAATATKEDRVQLNDDFKARKAELKEKMAAAVEAYRNDKPARDAAAFKVLDYGRDGMIQKKEFIAAFEIGSPTNTQLKEALGLDIGRLFLKT